MISSNSRSLKFSTFLFLCFFVLCPNIIWSAGTDDLLAWVLEAKAIKEDEIVQLKSGKAPVNGYAVMGYNCPPHWLTGNPEEDQACSTEARLDVLEEEIASLDRVLSYLNRQDTQNPKKSSDKNLLINGDFQIGLTGWRLNTSGYGSTGAVNPLWSAKPETSTGCLKLQVMGGTQSASQLVRFKGHGLEFRVKIMVERWSTFDSGRPGGWASVTLTFVDRNNESIGSTYYYLNPHAPSKNGPGIIWKRMEPALPTPTPWTIVRADLSRIAAEHGIDQDQLVSVWITAVVFGTHEDKSPTVACFDDLSIIESR